MSLDVPFVEVALRDPCPCGRVMQLAGKTRVRVFADCCAPHMGAPLRIPDAEALMRSRYTAFVLGHVDHLAMTWHATTRPSDLVLEPGQKWLGLEVRRHRLLDATHAEVEFVARSRWEGRGQRLHECSRFLHEAGQWWYVDGTQH